MVLSKFKSQSFSAVLLATFAQAELSDFRSSVPSVRGCNLHELETWSWQVSDCKRLACQAFPTSSNDVSAQKI